MSALLCSSLDATRTEDESKDRRADLLSFLPSFLRTSSPTPNLRYGKNGKPVVVDSDEEMEMEMDPPVGRKDRGEYMSAVNVVNGFASSAFERTS